MSAQNTPLTAFGMAPPFVPPTLENRIDASVWDVADRAGRAAQLPQVLAITRELFPEPFDLRAVQDPESGDWYITIEVRVAGELADVQRRDDEWWRRVAPVVRPDTDLIRLLVYPVE